MEIKKTESNSIESIGGATELSPQLAAFEATLASAKPLPDESLKERAKAHALLEICRQAAPQVNLVETILDAGEERITSSLRQYVRAERFRSGLLGLVLGLIFGAILNIFGMAFLFMLLKIL